MAFSYTKLMQAMAAAGVVSATDPFFNNVSLLLPGNGTNGAQNNTFLDSSSNNYTITRNGNTTQGSFSPFSEAQGYWSIFFDSTSSSAIQLGTTVFNSLPSAFTFEAYVFPLRYGSSATQYYNTCIFGKGATYMNFGLQSGGNVQLYHYDGTQRSAASTGTVPLGRWSHVAAVITGGTIYFYINGVASGTATWYGIDVAANGTDDTFGYTADANAGTNRYFGGFISNARFTKAAVYSGAFTPSTTPLLNNAASTDSTFLIAQANRFIDDSVSPITFAAYGGKPAVVPAYPFTTPSAYSSSSNGASGFFDGNDYLSSNGGGALGNGAFTIELWAYPTALASSYNHLLDTRPTDANGFSWGVESDNQVFFYSISAFRYQNIGYVPLNAWAHMAITRDSSNNLRAYLNGAQIGTTIANFTANYTETTTLVGQYFGGAQNWTGFISNIRLLAGTAKYTGTTYTVPTSPVASEAGTTLLLNFANAGVYDAAARNDLETVGNTSISTAVSKFGGSSIRFDGSGDYLKIQNSSNGTMDSLVNWYTGNNTIEFWLYPITFTQGVNIEPVIIGNFNPVGSQNYWAFGPIASGLVQFYYFNTNPVKANTTFTMTGNTWTHLAMVKVGAGTTGNITVYANGNLVLNTAISGTPQSSGTQWPFIIGQTGNASFNGYIQDVRITQGVARYTANFTPTTVAFPVQ